MSVIEEGSSLACVGELMSVFLDAVDELALPGLPHDVLANCEAIPTDVHREAVPYLPASEIRKSL